MTSAPSVLAEPVVSSQLHPAPSLNVVGLFAGIGGIELGLQSHGHHALLLCEIEPAAQEVLRHHFMRAESPHFSSATELVADVKDVVFPEGTELVAAGFPCTDVSQAGRTAGIRGKNTGLIQHVFRHLEDQASRLGRLRWLLLENVPFLLQLDRGEGMRYLVSELERHGFTWAYRVVDAQAFGLPQRRQRVILLASRTEDPRRVLFADDAVPVERQWTPDSAVGFYWTEGLRGLGWAVEAVPTLKGGSTVGIPSPPAVLLPGGRVVVPTISAAEVMQGLQVGWTQPMADAGYRPGARWKAVGNAVAVPVSSWVGMRLSKPGDYGNNEELVDVTAEPWPKAAWGTNGKVFRVRVSTWPVATPPSIDLSALVGDGKALSPRATMGFLSRLTRSKLRQRRNEAFVGALIRHYLREGGDPQPMMAIERELSS